ncbi:MAG: hypothetical protein Q4G59_06645 [Planctomycetia bacterium]|nr:hypothetical protein [Planctomycetia bacterium]
MTIPKPVIQTVFPRWMFVLTLVFFVVISAGCKGEKRPKGFPELYPVTLEVLNEGKPAEDVAITLVSKDQSIRWSVGGRTDASGKAILMTHGQYRGVPSGDYSVTMTKTDMDNKEEFLTGLDETKKDSGGEKKCYNTYSLIDQKNNDAKTSGLELKVEDKGTTQSYELGPAVKKLISTYRPGSM